ncbi:hypothetical protein GQ43DRAFT_439211 [Delitschia confertaspora ATCC 74209]|uniref:Uncharacterized protein n=1 Tax=Delitschia confertaspora ATCC 74209 TaxID=1513339 RepID=A0A9P4JPW8_9PLEO|nr:hypothetical protein GQ43DRAFT_439211 [Delitschia confertaspora ATCC 74209]
MKAEVCVKEDQAPASAEIAQYRGKGTKYVNQTTGQTYVRVRKGPTRLKGYAHLFDAHASWKWFFPNVYRKPAYGYEKLGQHRHRDILTREWVGDYDDRYISACDGKISKLVVQAVDEIYDNYPNSTWRRTFIRNISPLFLRIANWPFNHVDYSNGGPNSEDYPLIIAKWFAASIAIAFVVGSPWATAEGQSRNEGKYDPFPYMYYGYPKVARNMLENETLQGYRLNETHPVAERILRPRFLCFLTEEGRPANLMNVEEWINQYDKSGRNLSYLFVAYTQEQFPDEDQYNRELHEIADAAARNAGVTAYWIGNSCMPEPHNLTEDIYRICDVIRGAHSLVIAVRRPPTDIHGTLNTTDLMLQQWGNRVWTFPEVLLSPAGKDIRVYTHGEDLLSPTLVAKNQFAAKVWTTDAHVARQLIDHYEGNLILNQLELVTLALECLQKRRTQLWFPGDHAYALMGLLRIRPKIDPSDTAFQAFARLSLANDSNQLLERLICMHPKDPNQDWHCMDDGYGSQLWDILPQEVNVAGIGNDDTILLDGCRAANVRWKSFSPVAYKRIKSWKRWLAEQMLRTMGYVLLLSLVFLIFYKPVGYVLLVYSLALIALGPWLIHMLYLGKFWGTQGWFFGFEGHMDIETIERQIFGARLGRMQWSINASPLSRHYRNAQDECVGEDPTNDPAIAQLVENAKRALPGQQRIFTIVDTGTMTATLIQAARPPVCFIVAAAEGGMQRAIGCSYDWTTQTLYRETVMRLPTTVLDQMSRVTRVKIGFKREMNSYGPMGQVGEAVGKRVE